MITKNTFDFSSSNFEEGEIILIDKALRKSSFNVVYKVRKAINVKKVGHAGTLDPLATGLLIICTGKKTREIESFQMLPKTYSGVITLGKTTSSMDSETEIVEEKSIAGISEFKIDETRKKFIGRIKQIPPMFSAVKFKGKSLYKYARKGIEVKREPREVCISDFKIIKIELPYIHFRITCSKGTYIRVLAHDFGQELCCGAYLSALCRTGIGDYNVDDALQIEDFVQMASDSITR